MYQDNPVALITGGSSGLGLACAKRLLARNVRVVVWDKKVSTEVNNKNYYSFCCDVSSEHEVEEIMQETIVKTGIPRIIINCAGIAPAKKMVGRDGVMPLDDFRKVIDINLIGTFNVMRKATQVMLELPIDEETNERGVIINTASIAAFEGQIGQLAYSASKGAIVSMTLPAARELASLAIRVNTIAPGLFQTPLLTSMPEEVQNKLAETVNFPKRLGQPDEFAALVEHIIENNYLNGEVIRLDGALRMQAR